MSKYQRVAVSSGVLSEKLGDSHIFGRSKHGFSIFHRCLYAFLQPGSSIHDLPAEKLPMARPSQQESLILDILGKERAEEPGQLQMALKFMSELKQTL